MKAANVLLLVEDNPADIKITQRAFQESKLPVDLVVVRDGQEAVDYLLRQGKYAAQADWRPPELILLDLNLPRLTGQQVLERIRGSEKLRSIPVVVLTTSRREEEVRGVYAAGANTYIQKPQEFKRFVEVLRTIGNYWLETALLPPPRKPER
jgi:CheY-like chemotaxis protein